MALPWDELFEFAVGQHGFFTPKDALSIGMTLAALSRSPQVCRIPGYRGLYRFKRFPADTYDGHVAFFVWSQGKGVVSHGSALDFYELSDYLPHRLEVTLPPSWYRRKSPDGVYAFYEDLLESDVVWGDAFRVTTARKAVVDFIDWGIRPDLATQALDQGVQRKLFHRRAISNRFDLL